MNSFTTEKDLISLLDRIDEIVQKLNHSD